jgi:hypothetical protein
VWSALVTDFFAMSGPPTRSWILRAAKLKLKEMGSRYLFIILYVWLEKYFSRGDYRRPTE